MFKKKKMTTIFSTSWITELQKKINEVVVGFNELEERVEKNDRSIAKLILILKTVDIRIEALERK